MAIPPTSRMISIPADWRSREAGSFFCQLDELSERMFTDLRGVSSAELAKQLRPGTNTIGMLLAHIAIVEVFWLMMATSSYRRERLQAVLGIGEDDDGMPLKEGGRPPAKLRGRTLAWYRKLHERARRYAKRTARTFSPAGMRRVLAWTRADGSRRSANVRWILYHVLEHQAGHYGQVLLLRHLHRAGGRKGT